MDREKNFIKHITNEVYKMLVLKEREDCGENVYLEDYINNLFIEIDGACIWSDWLKCHEDYVVVTSIIAHLSKNNLEYKQYRREIFKMLNLLNKIDAEIEV